MAFWPSGTHATVVLRSTQSDAPEHLMVIFGTKEVDICTFWLMFVKSFASAFNDA